MKKVILPMLFIFMATIAFAQHSKQELVGKWQGIDNKSKDGSLIFKDKTKVALVVNGKESPYFDFSINLQKTPAPFDITVRRPDGHMVTLKTLLQFLDNNTIKWQIFEIDERPVNFNEGMKDSILILKRVKA